MRANWIIYISRKAWESFKHPSQKNKCTISTFFPSAITTKICEIGKQIRTYLAYSC